jgi:uncharacterized protein (TIGR02145 family)
MIENMRLVPSTANITNTNTNSPMNGFAEEAAASSTSDALCGVKGDPDCNNQLQYNTNNLNRSITQSYNTAGRRVAWYSYGVYYNWYTATAGNGTTDTGFNVTVNGDLCPAGWRLPTGNNGDYVALNAAVSIDSGDTGLRNYPNNFVWSGDYNKTSRTNGGINGRYWTATSYGVDSSYRLGFQPDKMSVNGNYEKWDAFAVRCVHGNVGESSPEVIEDEPEAAPLQEVHSDEEESSPEIIEDEPVVAPLQAAPTPVNNYDTPEETESVTENDQVSDSYAAPQGVSKQTMRSTEETIDDTPVVVISTAVVAAVSAIGVIAVARYRNDNDEKEGC